MDLTLRLLGKEDAEKAKPLVIVAEDSRLERRLLKDFMERKGYEVVEAANGQEAIEKVQAKRPSLLLLDIHMPDLSGMEVLFRLKELGLKMKTIMVTSNMELQLVKVCYQWGANHYVRKPVDFHHLETLLTVMGA